MNRGPLLKRTAVDGQPFAPVFVNRVIANTSMEPHNVEIIKSCEILLEQHR